MAAQSYSELLGKLPYQRVKDSPTVKYYTNWNLFDERINIGQAYITEPLPKPLSELNIHATMGAGETVVFSRHDVLLAGIMKAKDLPPYASLKPFKLLRRTESKITALHAERWNSGVYVNFPPSTIIRDPVVVASLSGEGYIGHHVMVEVGRGAEARLVLLDYSGRWEGLKTLVAEIRLEEAAKLELIRIVIHGPGSPVYSHTVAHLAGGAELEVKALALGGAMTHLRDDYALAGELGKVHTAVSLISLPGTRLDTITNAAHLAPRTSSRITVRGAVMGDGYLVHRGVARVVGEARWSATSIDSYINVFSDRGSGYAVPMLEIQTGDVEEARHSAAVASLSDDQLFYLQSRGLTRQDVEALLARSILEYSGAAEAAGLEPATLLALGESLFG